MPTKCTILLTARGVHLARYESSGGPWKRSEGMYVELDVPGSPAAVAEHPEFARTLAGRVRTALPDIDRCSLIVPASWCLHQSMPVEHERLTDEAIEFAFEQYIPCALEELACVTTRHGGTTAMITALPVAPMQRFLEELEDHGLSVDTLVTDARMLPPADSAGGCAATHTTILIADDHTTLVAWDNAGEKTAAVRTIRLPWPTAAEAIDQQIRATVGLDATYGEVSRVAHLTTSEPPGGEAGTACTCVPSDHILRGADAAHLIMDHAVCDNVADNLRIGQLGHARRWQIVQRHASRFLVAAAVALAALGIKLHLETAAQAKAAAALEPIRTQIYQDVFPGEKLTPAASMKMASYRVKLEGLTADTGHGAGADIAARVDPLVPLIRFVGHIPDSTKLFVDELTVDGSRLRVRGRTLAHEAAGDLVRALNATGYWTVDPPRTKLRSDGTVEFRIQCEEAADD